MAKKDYQKMWNDLKEYFSTKKDELEKIASNIELARKSGKSNLFLECSVEYFTSFLILNKMSEIEKAQKDD